MHSRAWCLARRAAERGVWAGRRPSAKGIQVCRSGVPATRAGITTGPTSYDQRRVSLPSPDWELQSLDPNELVLDFLNSESNTYIPVILPQHGTRLDAFLHLREHAPQLLADVTDDALHRLCMQTGVERLGGVVQLLLSDLDGKAEEENGMEDDLSRKLREANRASKGGILAAVPGSRRRLGAVQNLVIGASRRRMESPEKRKDDIGDGVEGHSQLSLIFSTSSLARAFAMLMQDYEILKRREGNAFGDVSPLPQSLDPTVARRLIRSISWSHDSIVAPILGELIKHIEASKADIGFPSAVEGCAILEYYMSLDVNTDINSASFRPSTASGIPPTLQACNYVLDLMSKSHPDIISSALIEAAGRDGREYYEYLHRNGVEASEAEQLSFRVTIHTVIILILLKKTRFIRIEQQLNHVIKEVESTAERLFIQPPLWIIAKTVRLSIYLALNLTQNSAVRAFSLTRNFVNVLLDAKGSESEANGALLKALNEKALQEELPNVAAEALNILVTRDGRYVDRISPEAEIIGGDGLNMIFSHLAKHGRQRVVARLVEEMGLIDSEGVVIDAQIDRLFPPPIREGFIASLAQAGLKAQSRTMYERWAAPLIGEIGALAALKFNSDVKRSATQMDIVKSDTKVARVRHISPVRLSTTCLTSLATLFTQGKPVPMVPVPQEGQNARLSPDIQFVFHVLFHFSKGRKVAAMEFDEQISVASALTSLGLTYSASHLLRNMLQLDTAAGLKNAHVYVRALGLASVEEAAQVLVEIANAWPEQVGVLRKENKIEWPRQMEDQLIDLFSIILEACFRLSRYELAHELYECARGIGLHENVGLKSLNSLIVFGLAIEGKRSLALAVAGSKQAEGFRITREMEGSDNLFIARWVEKLVEKDGWSPDPGLLSWMISDATTERRVLRAEGSSASKRQDGQTGKGESVDDRLREGANGGDDEGGTEGEMHVKDRTGEERKVENEHGEEGGIEEETGGRSLQARSLQYGSSDRDSGDPVQQRGKTYTLKDKHRRAAIILLSLSARQLGYVHVKSVRDVIMCIHTRAKERRKVERGRGKRQLSPLARELDEVVDIVRWVQLIDVEPLQSIQDEIDKRSRSRVLSAKPALQPNRLPPYLYRALIVAYLRTDDVLGAANVLTWAREEAQLTLQDIEVDWRGDRMMLYSVFETVLQGEEILKLGYPPDVVVGWFKEQGQAPKVKMWWEAPNSRRLP